MNSYRVDVEAPDGNAGDTISVEAASVEEAKTRALDELEAQIGNNDWLVTGVYRKEEDGTSH